LREGWSPIVDLRSKPPTGGVQPQQLIRLPVICSRPTSAVPASVLRARLQREPWPAGTTGDKVAQDFHPWSSVGTPPASIREGIAYPQELS
jgi:hypothetical protein